MAGDIKVFSDYSEVTVSDVKKILAESGTTDLNAYITGLGIFNYLATKGLLTQTQIEALSSLIKTSDFVDNESLIWKNASGTIENILVSALETALSKGFSNLPQFSITQSGGNTIINLETVINCKNNTNEYDIYIPSTWSKYANVAFSAGSGNGALDTGTFEYNRVYYIWAVHDPTGLLSDIVVSLSSSSPTNPGAYAYERLVGAFWHTNSPRDYNYVIPITDIYDSEIIQKLPYDYISDIIVAKTTSSTVTIQPNECKDDSNAYDIKNLADLEKDFTSAFAEGSGNGMLDTGSISDETMLFIFEILNPTNGAVDYLCSLSGTSPTMPTGFTKKRIIGYIGILNGYTSAPSTDLFELWTVNAPAGTYAYLTTAGSTQALTAATEAAISAAFTNNPRNQFIADGDELVYKGLGGWFKIDIDCSVAYSLASTKITFSVNHKPSGGSYSQIAGASMPNFLRNAGEDYNQGLTCFVELDTNDRLQLVVEADNGGTITYDNYTATILEMHK